MRAPPRTHRCPVLQGKRDEELPEVILGVLEVDHIDLFRVMKKIDEHMQADLARRKLDE